MQSEERSPLLNRRGAVTATAWFVPGILLATAAPAAAASGSADLVISTLATDESQQLLPGTKFSIGIVLSNAGTDAVPPGAIVSFDAPSDLFGSPHLHASPGWSLEAGDGRIVLRLERGLGPRESSAPARVLATRPIDSTRWPSPGEPFITTVTSSYSGADADRNNDSRELTVWPAQRTTTLEFAGAGILQPEPVPPGGDARWELTMSNRGPVRIPAGFSIDVFTSAPSWTTWFDAAGSEALVGSTPGWAIDDEDEPTRRRVRWTQPLPAGATTRLQLTLHRPDPSPSAGAATRVGFNWEESYAVNETLVDPEFGVVDSNSLAGSMDFVVTLTR